MSEDFDLGDIILQRRIPVGDRDTTADLFQKTITIFPRMILEALDLIEAGGEAWTKQDPGQATFFHKRSVEDSRIDWNRSAEDIVNLVRAQPDPYPNAFAYHRGRRLRVLEASVTSRYYGGTPGRIFCREGDGIVIVCGPRAQRGREKGLLIRRVRTEDGDEYPAREYFQAMGGYLTAVPDLAFLQPDRSVGQPGS
jgi:methionyl-tRNA formyltransferase